MAFDNDFGFECEQCGATIGGGLYDFWESKDLMENDGWITRKVDGEYLNFCCETCLKEYREKH